jgi:endogenous inhibitor of DNA gyrase (YacG/DUF329 family)
MAATPMCVMCRSRPVDSRWRPFCSERCKTLDLARWADESYRVASEKEEDDEDEDEKSEV